MKELTIHTYLVEKDLPRNGDTLTVLCGKRLKYPADISHGINQTGKPCKTCRQLLTERHAAKKSTTHITLAEPHAKR